MLWHVYACAVTCGARATTCWAWCCDMLCLCYDVLRKRKTRCGIVAQSAQCWFGLCVLVFVGKRAHARKQTMGAAAGLFSRDPAGPQELWKVAIFAGKVLRRDDCFSAFTISYHTCCSRKTTDRPTRWSGRGIERVELLLNHACETPLASAVYF